MKDFFDKYNKGLKNISLIGMMVLPFLLYFAARSDSPGIVNVLLGLMGLSMLLAMKVG